MTTLEGHLSYINDCVIEPVSGLNVASVSGKQQLRNDRCRSLLLLNLNLFLLKFKFILRCFYKNIQLYVQQTMKLVGGSPCAV